MRFSCISKGGYIVVTANDVCREKESMWVPKFGAFTRYLDVTVISHSWSSPTQCSHVRRCSLLIVDFIWSTLSSPHCTFCALLCSKDLLCLMSSSSKLFFSRYLVGKCNSGLPYVQQLSTFLVFLSDACVVNVVF